MSNISLVGDLDGTLTSTDTLVESILQVIRLSPFNLLRLLGWLLQGAGRIQASHRAADATFRRDVAVSRFAAGVSAQREEPGAAPDSCHRSARAHRPRGLGPSELFDRVLASNQHTNLKGVAKLQAIQAEIGSAFAYAGDSREDILSGSRPRPQCWWGCLPRRQDDPVEYANRMRVSTAQAELSVWLRALRLHQWLNNLLLFVPLLTSFFLMNPDRLLSVLLAFLAFSLAASATYVVNDLWDLENDRAHPRKRRRYRHSGPAAEAGRNATLTAAGGWGCLMK